MGGGQTSTRKKFYKKLGVTVDLDKRIITLNGFITSGACLILARTLQTMQLESVEAPIVINIVRSRGGCMVAATMIYAMLRACIAPVQSRVRHYAESAACYIFQGASERIMSAGSHVALHWAVLSAISDGMSIKDIELEYRTLSRSNQYLSDLIQRRTGMPASAINKLWKTLVPIGPRDAVKLGLADKIGGRKRRKNKKVGE